ncbi:MAG: DUF3352 domain-containing protein [Prochlorococcus sp.]|nr:DUF3352 domain-containing protein [Prochlorococcaceae cyanobacterium ETNP18_MAG_1]
MKARSFLIAVAATVLALLLLVAGLGWTMVRQSPLRVVDQPLQLPRAARFVPRQAALSLHWLADPGQLPAYAQAVATARQRGQARDGASQLRDGAFALAGLDFDAELADWLGSQVSLTLLEPDGPQGRIGWVLALASRDEDGAKRFLQRFWQTRSLAGTDLQISSYRGMGVISGRGALLGRDPQPLATALIDDDLILLASGRGVLEQSLDVSQLSDQHQLGDEELSRLVGNLGDGVAVVTASPSALHSWFGLPESVSQRDDLRGLVAGLQLDGADLAVEGLLRFQNPLPGVETTSAAGVSLLNGAGGPADVVAVLGSPSRLLDPADQDPLVQWLGPELRQQLTKVEAPLASTIAGLDDGPLLWLQEPKGWVLGTQQDHPAIDQVDEAFVEQGFVKADLKSDDQPMQVWTQIVRKNRRSYDSLETQLGVALVQESGQAWWGKTLAALQQRKQTNALQPRLGQLKELSKGNGQSLANQIVLAAEPGRLQLKHWRPWTLIQTVAGRSLQPSVQGLAMAVGPDQEESSSGLRLRARLSLG